ncbi:MAG: anti-phage protein KwaB [Paludibacter sp.]
MTLLEIQDRITYLTTTTVAIGLTLYVIYNNKEGEEQIRLADIDPESGLELKKLYLDYLTDKFLQNDDLSLIDISNGDNRKNIAYYYDLEEKPIGLNAMNIIAQNDNQPQFSFSKDDFDGIKAFVIAIGNENNKILLFKNHHHLSVLSGITAFGIKMNDHRFVRVREDIIKLSQNIDFIQIENELIVISLKTLESGFGFENIIRKKAAENIEAIDTLNLLEDISILTEMATDIRKAKHLMRIKTDSPVMLLPVATVISFVKNHKPIMKKFRLSEDGTKLKLDTKVSQKLFLALMNDDLLTSELTKLYYEGIAKDPMIIED